LYVVSSIRTMPENEIPPAMRVDVYCILAKCNDGLQDNYIKFNLYIDKTKNKVYTINVFHSC